jgi:hypothetical protein
MKNKFIDLYPQFWEPKIGDNVMAGELKGKITLIKLIENKTHYLVEYDEFKDIRSWVSKEQLVLGIWQ